MLEREFGTDITNTQSGTSAALLRKHLEANATSMSVHDKLALVGRRADQGQGSTFVLEDAPGNDSSSVLLSPMRSSIHSPSASPVLDLKDKLGCFGGSETPDTISQRSPLVVVDQEDKLDLFGGSGSDTTPHPSRHSRIQIGSHALSAFQELQAGSSPVSLNPEALNSATSPINRSLESDFDNSATQGATPAACDDSSNVAETETKQINIVTSESLATVSTIGLNEPVALDVSSDSDDHEENTIPPSPHVGTEHLDLLPEGFSAFPIMSVPASLVHESPVIHTTERGESAETPVSHLIGSDSSVAPSLSPQGADYSSTPPPGVAPSGEQIWLDSLRLLDPAKEEIKKILSALQENDSRNEQDIEAAREKISWIIIINDGTVDSVRTKMILKAILVAVVIASLLILTGLVPAAGLVAAGYVASVVYGSGTLLAAITGGFVATEVAVRNKSYRFGLFQPAPDLNPEINEKVNGTILAPSVAF